MNRLIPIALAALASVAFAAENRNTAPNAPVLRKLEPDDSVVILLPGPKRAAAPVRATARVAPVPTASPLPTRLETASLPPLPVVPSALRPPPTTTASQRPVSPSLPPEARQDLGIYCHKFIGKWKAVDARGILGPPLRNRPAYDENKTANGRIYAYSDPTNRYRELELDFDSATGALRTVFVYPAAMTWKQVRTRWNGQISAADAQHGRKFYSYVNRRMDVLVDAHGRVISLGLY